MSQQAKKGFTLIELMVIIIIISILATFAIMQYSRFIERMRIAEAENMIGMGLSAQQRHIIQKGIYAVKWPQLDIILRNDNTNSHLSDDGKIFYTKGREPSKTEERNNFEIYFEQINNRWFVTARRTGHETYHYQLVRPFEDQKVYCVPQADNEEDITICLDFSGLKDISQLPQDPRIE